MTCVKKRGFFFWGVVVCSLGGESWDRKKEVDIGEERVGRVVIYSLLLMESPTDFLCRWFRRQFRWWIGHITAWRSWFESLGDSVGKLSTKTSTSANRLFFFIIFLNMSSVIPSVYTDWLTDGIVVVNKYHRNVPT
jgi:hypothetical protein